MTNKYDVFIKFKKVLLFFVLFSLFTCSTSSIFANSNELVVNEIGSGLFEIIGPNGEKSTVHENNVGTDNHQLDVFTASGEKYVISSNTNVLTIQKNNQTIDEINLYENGSIAISQFKASGPAWEGPWKTLTQGRGSNSLTAGDYGMIIGVIAAIAGVSIGNSIIITVTTWLVSRHVPEAYYYGKQQVRTWHGWVESRRITTYYTDSNYNKVVPGSSTVYSSPVKLHTVQ